MFLQEFKTTLNFDVVETKLGGQREIIETGCQLDGIHHRSNLGRYGNLGFVHTGLLCKK